MGTDDRPRPRSWSPSLTALVAAALMGGSLPAMFGCNNPAPTTPGAPTTTAAASAPSLSASDTAPVDDPVAGDQRAPARTDACPSSAATTDTVKVPSHCPLAIIEGNRIITLQKITFFVDKPELRPQSHKLVAAVAALLLDHQEIERLTINVHTSATRKFRTRSLARNRARAIRELMAKQGVRKHRIDTAQIGDSRPLVPSDRPNAASINRRIEFVISSRGSVTDVPLP